MRFLGLQPQQLSLNQQHTHHRQAHQLEPKPLHQLTHLSDLCPTLVLLVQDIPNHLQAHLNPTSLKNQYQRSLLPQDQLPAIQETHQLQLAQTPRVNLLHRSLVRFVRQVQLLSLPSFSAFLQSRCYPAATVPAAT